MTSLTDTLRKDIEAAFLKRKDLMAVLESQGTNTLRLFHGAIEGWAGFTIDKYGDVILMQNFRHDFPTDLFAALEELLKEQFGADKTIVYNHRTKQSTEVLTNTSVGGTFQENGLSFHYNLRKTGADPSLFLDFRVVRKWLIQHSQGKRVVNHFAYTCGAGLAAESGGASEVWNIDFSETALALGAENTRLNQFENSVQKYVHSDFFPAARQFAGLPLKGRGRNKKSFPKFGKQSFDIQILDPPTWSKSSWGAVDIVRDYQSLFKPCVLSTTKGGCILATNHVSSVSFDDWRELLVKCAAKAGRPISSIEKLLPEEDFPSHDGNYPLKIALCFF